MTIPADVAVPSNPAAALFAALRPVYVDSPGQVIQEGLSASFGEAFGSPDFWKVHRGYLRVAETVALVVASHPNLERQYARYVDSWRRGLIPNTSWERPASENVGSYDVQSLEFLAGTLDVMNIGNAPLDDELSSQLDKLVASWKQLIESLDLPPGLAAELLVRLRELEWMIANVGRFGVSAVAEAAERLATRATREIFRPSLTARARKGLIAAVTATVIFVGGANTATNDFAGAIEGINNSIVEVHELEQNVRGILTGKLPELNGPSESGAENSSPDVVDVEVVDDPPPAGESTTD